MIISPKCSTKLDDLKVMLAHAKEHIEVQNFDMKHHTELIEDIKVLRYIVENSEVWAITYHMPDMLCNIEDLVANRHALHSVYSFILECNHFEVQYGVGIRILFHTEVKTDSLLMNAVVKTVKQLKLRCTDGVQILLENPIINPNCISDGLSVFKVAYLAEVSVCLDITHFQASNFMLSPHILNDEQRFKIICGPYYNKVDIAQIHMACAGDRDGFARSSTHGNPHRDLFALRWDINLISRFRCVDKLIYVAEVSEMDYTQYKHTNQIKELDLLKQHRAQICNKDASSALKASYDISLSTAERQELNTVNFKIPYRKGV